MLTISFNGEQNEIVRNVTSVSVEVEGGERILKYTYLDKQDKEHIARITAEICIDKLIEVELNIIEKEEQQ